MSFPGNQVGPLRELALRKLQQDERREQCEQTEGDVQPERPAPAGDPVIQPPSSGPATDEKANTPPMILYLPRSRAE